MENFIYCVAAIALMLLALFFDNIKTYFEFIKWKRKNKNSHTYDQDVVFEALYNMAEEGMTFHGESVPVGRAKWFIMGNKSFSKKIDPEALEFYGYTPYESKTEPDFHEYGLLLTQNGFLYCMQANDRSNKDNKTKSYSIPFKGLWKVEYTKKGNTIDFYYSNRIVQIKYKAKKELCEELVLAVNTLIQTGYTQDIQTGYVAKIVEKEVENIKFSQLDHSIEMNVIGALSSIYANIPDHFKEISLNSIAAASQGHGIAAEYANNLVDKVKHPFETVTRVGQNNAKNGPDRIVGNKRIQTKYYADYRDSVKAAFETASNGGTYKYGDMILEVPRDQYADCLKLMKEYIAEGKVPGTSNPNDAIKIIKKGAVSYRAARLIAEGGNTIAIGVDTLDGVVCTAPTAGISSIIAFAQAKWLGVDNKNAIKAAGKTGGIALGKGTLVYAGSQEIAKVTRERFKGKYEPTKVAKKSGTIISLCITFGPDAFKTLTGKISGMQFIKNSATNLGGIAAGAATATVIGSTGPVGVAATIGASMAGGAVTKKLLDSVIKDDKVKMFTILKEEYIDAVMSVYMSQIEFENIQNDIFDDNLDKKLEDIFHARKKDDPRRYARKEIVEKAILNEFSKRVVIEESELPEEYI